MTNGTPLIAKSHCTRWAVHVGHGTAGTCSLTLEIAGWLLQNCSLGHSPKFGQGFVNAIYSVKKPWPFSAISIWRGLGWSYGEVVVPSGYNSDVQKLNGGIDVSFSLAGLAECEHLVLLALFRQGRSKGSVRTLSTVLEELLRLVDCNGCLASVSG